MAVKGVIRHFKDEISNRNEIMLHQFFLPLNPLKGTFTIYKRFRCLQLKPLQSLSRFLSGGLG